MWLLNTIASSIAQAVEKLFRWAPWMNISYRWNNIVGRGGVSDIQGVSRKTMLDYRRRYIRDSRPFPAKVGSENRSRPGKSKHRM